MGLGTSAAKTSFFGSLQAVVCAGIWGVQRLIVACSLSAGCVKTFTFFVYCDYNFWQKLFYDQMVWPCLARNNMNKAALLRARHHLCGRETVQDWNPCGSSNGCGRSSVCLMIWVSEVWFQSIVVHMLIPNMIFIAFWDKFDSFKQLAVHIIFRYF